MSSLPYHHNFQIGQFDPVSKLYSFPSNDNTGAGDAFNSQQLESFGIGSLRGLDPNELEFRREISIHVCTKTRNVGLPGLRKAILTMSEHSNKNMKFKSESKSSADRRTIS